MGVFDFLFGASGASPFFAGGPETIYRAAAPVNRRDAASIAANLPNTVPPLPPAVEVGAPPLPPQQQQQQMQLPPPPPGAGDPPDLYVPDGFTRFLNAPGNIFDMIGAAVDSEGAKQKALAQYYATQKLRNDAYKSGVQELGNSGVLYNPQAGTSVPIPQAAIDQFNQVQGMMRKGAGGSNGAEYGQTFIDPDTQRAYYGWIGQDAAGRPQVTAQDLNGQPAPAEVARRLIPTTTSNITTKGASKFQFDQIKDYAEKADAASTSNSALDQLEANFAGAAKTGWGGDAVRWLAEQVGVDIGDINLASKQGFETAQKQIGLALQRQYLSGQGAVTEWERKAVNESIPSLRTDPRAFGVIVQRMRAINDRAIMLNDAAQSYRQATEDSPRMWRFFTSGLSKAQAYANATRDTTVYNRFADWATNSDLSEKFDPGPMPAKAPGGGANAPAAAPAARTQAPATPMPQGVQEAPGPSGKTYKWSVPQSQEQVPSNSVVIPLNQQRRSELPPTFQGSGGPNLPVQQAAMAEAPVLQADGPQFVPTDDPYIDEAPRAPVMSMRANGTEPRLSQRQRIQQFLQQLSRATPEGRDFNRLANEARTAAQRLKLLQKAQR